MAIDQPDAIEASSGGNAPDTSIPGELWVVIKRIPTYARLAAAMVRDPNVPKSAKAFLVAGGAYLVSPVDLVPGLIPVAGQLDDLYVVLTGFQQAAKRCSPEVVSSHFAAVGLDPAIVDEDLAAIRRFVKRGVGWAIRRGVQIAGVVAEQASTLVDRARTRKDKPL